MHKVKNYELAHWGYITIKKSQWTTHLKGQHEEAVLKKTVNNMWRTCVSSCYKNKVLCVVISAKSED